MSTASSRLATSCGTSSTTRHATTTALTTLHPCRVRAAAIRAWISASGVLSTNRARAHRYTTYEFSSMPTTVDAHSVPRMADMYRPAATFASPLSRSTSSVMQAELDVVVPDATKSVTVFTSGITNCVPSTHPAAANSTSRPRGAATLAAAAPPSATTSTSGVGDLASWFPLPPLPPPPPLPGDTISTIPTVSSAILWLLLLWRWATRGHLRGHVRWWSWWSTWVCNGTRHVTAT